MILYKLFNIFDKSMIDAIFFFEVFGGQNFDDLGSNLELLGVDFGSSWRLLEGIFAPLGPPGMALGS